MLLCFRLLVRVAKPITKPEKLSAIERAQPSCYSFLYAAFLFPFIWAPVAPKCPFCLTKVLRKLVCPKKRPRPISYFDSHIYTYVWYSPAPRKTDRKKGLPALTAQCAFLQTSAFRRSKEFFQPWSEWVGKRPKTSIKNRMSNETGLRGFTIFTLAVGSTRKV